MSTRQQFSLRWNNYLRHVTSAFDTLRCQEDLVDVTLCCDGKKIRAHRMLLSACSTYFKSIFIENPCTHPVIIFRNVRYEDLCAIINFMYHGEVNVAQDQLASFLTTAELLEVQGLTDGLDKESESTNDIEIVKDTSHVIDTNTQDFFTQPKRRKLILKKRTDDEDVPHHSDPGISNIPVTETVSTTNLKVEAIDSIEDSNVNIVDNCSGPSIITFPEEIEICESETFHVTEDPNILNDLKSSEIIYSHSEPVPDLEVDGAPKDTTVQGVDWKTLLSVQNDILGNLVTLTAAVTPIQEVVKLQCDRKIMYSNIKNEIKNSTSCNICDKEFMHPNSLTHHKKSHQGETQCPICNKYYTRTYDLKRHMRTSHSAADESDKSS